nr:hypothetical protein [Tanacetum cinerariifolium]
MSSEKAEGHGDWNSPKYQDTTNSGSKKQMKSLIFHKIYTEEISDRYVAPCFINGLEAYDEEDDVKPWVVLGRSFMRLTKGIVDFRKGVIIIYPELDPFLDSSGETKKTDDDWDLLNKRKQLEKYQLINFDLGPSLSTGKPFTQEEPERKALAIDICKTYSLLEEERPVIKSMAYSDKQRGGDGCKKGITMLNHSKAEPMGLLKDVQCQVGERVPRKGQNQIKTEQKGKRGKARKSQKQLQSIKKEKLIKIQKEGPKMQTHSKFYKKKEVKRAAFAIT